MSTINRLMVAGKIIEYENDEIELSPWGFYLFNYQNLLNGPIGPDEKFTISSDDQSPSFQFIFKENKLYLTLLTPMDILKHNGQEVDSMADLEIGSNDVIEFEGKKFLINKNPSISETEARSFLGKLLISKTNAGVKSRVEEKQGQLQILGMEGQRLQRELKSLQDQLAKREYNKKMIPQMQQELEELENLNLEEAIVQIHKKLKPIEENFQSLKKEVQELQLKLKAKAS